MSLKPMILMSTVLLSSLVGCQQLPEDQNREADVTVNETSSVAARMSQKEQAAVEKLLWVEKAEAVADAKEMLESGGDIQIYAFSGRMKTHPGLTAKQYDEIEDRVVSTYLVGMGDIVFGDKHLELRKVAREYATAYNQAVYLSLAESR